jgi:dihydrofolate reductase
MKVILYMAMSINGYIAHENDDTSWVSQAECKSYREAVAEAGVVVYGRRTYEIALKEGSLPSGEALIVVLTNDKSIKTDNPRILIVPEKKPSEVVQFLEQKGYKKLIVGGGGILNSAFLKDSLVDEILLDVEPIVLGRGLQLFFPEDFKAKLNLLEIKKLAENLIQLRYQIEK